MRGESYDSDGLFGMNEPVFLGCIVNNLRIKSKHTTFDIHSELFDIVNEKGLMDLFAISRFEFTFNNCLCSVDLIY